MATTGAMPQRGIIIIYHDYNYNVTSATQCLVVCDHREIRRKGAHVDRILARRDRIEYR